MTLSFRYSSYYPLLFLYTLFDTFLFAFLLFCSRRRYHSHRGTVAPAPVTTTYPCTNCSTYRSICDRYIVRLSGYDTAYNNIRRAVRSLPGYDPSRSVRDNIILFGSEYNLMERCFSGRSRTLILDIAAGVFNK